MTPRLDPVPAPGWVVEPPAPADGDRWRELFRGYVDFYGTALTEPDLERVWGWLHDPDHVLRGLLAKDPSGAAMGIAHFRPYPRPLLASVGCFLDDLFVDPAARGTGAAEALLAAVRRTAAAQGWGAVRWITSESNARARAVYDRTATQTSLVTYEMTVPTDA